MAGATKVLIVDDNPEIVMATTLRLRSVGYETSAAADGREALDAVVANRPAVIVMDVLMPIMDGLAAISELKRREACKDVPVIMLSASLRDKQEALEAGARFFLTKPCPARDLIAALTAALAEVA